MTLQRTQSKLLNVYKDTAVQNIQIPQVKFDLGMSDYIDLQLFSSCFADRFKGKRVKIRILIKFKVLKWLVLL